MDDNDYPEDPNKMIADEFGWNKKQKKLLREILKEKTTKVINMNKKRSYDRKDKVADELVKITLDEEEHEEIPELLLDQSYEPHIVLPGKSTVAFPIRSKIFRMWLAGLYYQKTGKGFSGSTFEVVISTLEGKAFHEQNIKSLYNRIAKIDNDIYYDLGDDHSVVEVTSQGWHILEDSPVLFRRFSHQLPQAVPEKGGDLSKFLDFTNLKSEEDRLLITTYLVAVMIPDIPRAILVCVGDQGSAKSTLQKLIRSLIDPSRTELIKLRGSTDELSQTASHNFCLYLDNISRLSDDASDSLATFTTGIGFSKRKLYSDDDDILYNIKNAVGLNGINLMATKPDLLDRCLILELHRIPNNERLEERKFWSEFNNAKPKILGSLFDTLSKTLSVIDETHFANKPRMADYSTWAAAAAKVTGSDVESFLKAFNTNVLRQNQAAIDASPTAQVILQFMSYRKEYEGTPSDLYLKLRPIVEAQKIQIGGSNGFPKSSSWLVRKVIEVRQNLIALGINVITGDRTQADRVIKLVKTPTGEDKNKKSKDVKNDVIDGNAVIQPRKSMTPNDTNDGINDNKENAVMDAVMPKQPQNDTMSGMTSKITTLDNSIEIEDSTE